MASAAGHKGAEHNEWRKLATLVRAAVRDADRDMKDNAKRAKRRQKKQTPGAVGAAVRSVHGKGRQRKGLSTRAARVRRLRERLETERDPQVRAEVKAQLRAFGVQTEAD